MPPQTNEVGRSAALLAGLFDVVAATGVRRVRLLEVGASAGLNLLVDRFGFRGAGWAYRAGGLPGADSSNPIEGRRSGRRRSRSSSGGAATCTRSTPTSAAGRLLLTSFVWPFDVDRHERLAAALAVAREHPVAVDRRRRPTGWPSG